MNIVKTFKKNSFLFAVLLTYIVLLVTMPHKALESGKNSMYYVKEMIQIMPVIFILTSLIEAWVPRETIMNSFGESSGLKGSILSFLLGSFSAGPIYAAFPVCKMLLKKGASISNIVIILSAWAVVKVPMLANEAKFLGPRFMGIRWFLTTISIFVMAYIISILVDRESLPIANQEAKSSGLSLNIKEQYCIGCGLCENLSPDTFIIVDGKAKVIRNEITPDMKDQLKTTIKECPANAIYFK